MSTWQEYGECMLCGTRAKLHENAYGWHTCDKCGDYCPKLEKTRRVGLLEYFFWWLCWKFSLPSGGVVQPEWYWY